MLLILQHLRLVHKKIFMKNIKKIKAILENGKIKIRTICNSIPFHFKSIYIIILT